MRSAHFGAILSVALGLTASLAGADVVTIPASQDNTLYEDPNGGLSNGSGSFLFVGRIAPIGGELLRRAVLAFDIAGHLPPGARINSASLTLHMSKTIAGDHPATLHRLAAGWGEGASDAGSPGGIGTPPDTGDATWVHRFFDTELWTAPGGDYAATASATAMIGDIGSYAWSGPGMVADTQAWLDQPSTNHGWILIGDESIPTTAKRFDSREIDPPDFRPALEVDFTFGPPTVPTASNWSVVLLIVVLATASLVGARHRERTPRDTRASSHTI